MLGLIMLNYLMVSKSLPQSSYYYRNGVRYYPYDGNQFNDQFVDHFNDNGDRYRYQQDDVSWSHSSSYRTYGTRMAGTNEIGYYRDVGGAQQCPYNNEDSINGRNINKRSVESKKSVSKIISSLKTIKRRKRYDPNNYGSAYRSYDNYYRSTGCQEPCVWEAELPCDTSRMTSRYGYRDARYVRWDREVDSYYPRDKYRDVMEYFGGRAELREANGISILYIKQVRLEDKGVYRCYMENGDEKDFLEVKFYPKYPDGSTRC